MIENIDRMGKYFGWKYVSGKDETCIAAVVEKYNPEETYLEHDSEEWKTRLPKIKFSRMSLGQPK